MSRLDALLAALSARDLQTAADCFAADGTYREPHRPPLVGAVAIRAHFERFLTSGRDWSFRVDDVLLDGSRACVAFRYAQNEGAGSGINERAGCAIIGLNPHGFIEAWREYEG